MSQIVYLLVGLVGFPVFAKGGGPQYVLEPSFGYLVGFVPGALGVGVVAGHSPSFLRAFSSFTLSALRDSSSTFATSWPANSTQ
jgi:biotin transport system substrate-specific component